MNWIAGGGMTLRLPVKLCVKVISNVHLSRSWRLIQRRQELMHYVHAVFFVVLGCWCWLIDVDQLMLMLVDWCFVGQNGCVTLRWFHYSGCLLSNSSLQVKWNTNCGLHSLYWISSINVTNVTSGYRTKYQIVHRTRNIRCRSESQIRRRRHLGLQRVKRFPKLLSWASLIIQFGTRCFCFHCSFLMLHHWRNHMRSNSPAPNTSDIRSSVNKTQSLESILVWCWASWCQRWQSSSSIETMSSCRQDDQTSAQVPETYVMSTRSLPGQNVVRFIKSNRRFAFRRMLDAYCPGRTATITTSDPPYMTPVVKHMLRVKNALNAFWEGGTAGDAI